ncbi:mannitol dehydrogenase family protein [uncultured Catenibacterium sp.]|uniref:mannitol dehydrogenase family protein n=1 Tax=uncultured Catenibacterium sp. TaxID=286142 RepID=UPI0026026C04|nr:mannitol dehydrogenase family protein [uncultured Catenibacterium sp.]
MRLNREGITETSAWKEKGYSLPYYSIGSMKDETLKNPKWIHFGAGNIFRAFQANVVQELLNKGILKEGLLVAEGYDYEIIDKVYKKNNDLSILATLKADGSIEKTVIGSIAESYVLDPSREDYAKLKEVFANPSLQMASFTITEKGYSLVNGKGETLKDVAADMANGPLSVNSYMGKVSALLYHRFKNGQTPIAMVSMDNCSHNGDKLAAAIKAFTKAWVENKVVEKEFLDYVNDDKKVSFPWTMIDKITPRPHATVEEMLKNDGVEDMDPVVTSKNTYVAPFVNAEECQYLVIEDDFPNGREPLEKGGIIFTTREKVDQVEKMKVCTCLNPLHTALAIFGCLLGYKKISDEMNDAQLKKMVEVLGYDEGLKVVVDPKILNPKEFIDTVVQVRLPNPFMPDTPQRIATDTSQKLAIRYGETIKAYDKSAELDVADLKVIPMVIAGWLRYLMGVDDEGNAFETSPDPLTDELKEVTNKLTMQNKELMSYDTLEETVRPILESKKIFGVDLYALHMTEKICQYLGEMLEGPGAVRKVLEKI